VPEYKETGTPTGQTGILFKLLFHQNTYKTVQ